MTEETGLVEAASNLPVTAAVTPTTTPVALPPDWTIPKLAKLAHDFAVHMYDDDVLLAKHELTPDQYARLASNDIYKKMLEIASIEWNSPKSINQRLALEAAVTLEHVMPTIGVRMEDKREDLPGVIEAVKALTKIAGIGEQKQQAAPGEKFTITINLGSDVEHFEKTRTLEIQSLPEGAGANPALPARTSRPE
jgi:hypothetical protein